MKSCGKKSLQRAIAQQRVESLHMSAFKRPVKRIARHMLVCVAVAKWMLKIYGFQSGFPRPCVLTLSGSCAGCHFCQQLMQDKLSDLPSLTCHTGTLTRALHMCRVHLSTVILWLLKEFSKKIIQVQLQLLLSAQYITYYSVIFIIQRHFLFWYPWWESIEQALSVHLQTSLWLFLMLQQ